MKRHEAREVSTIYSELGTARAQIQELSDEVRRLRSCLQTVLSAPICADCRKGLFAGIEQYRRERLISSAADAMDAIPAEGFSLREAADELERFAEERKKR